MLVTKKQVINAMSLDVSSVDAALVSNGYTDNKIVYATFSGMSETASFRYSIRFVNDHTGKTELGFVYVKFDCKGNLLADY